MICPGFTVALVAGVSIGATCVALARWGAAGVCLAASVVVVTGVVLFVGVERSGLLSLLRAVF